MPATQQKSDASFTFKFTLLAFMAMQNAALNLFARWSRVVAQTEEGPGYAKTSVIVVCEALKIVVAFLLLKFTENLSWVDTGAKVYVETVNFKTEAAKLLVPSTLYVIQNNLVLVAAENLEGPVLAVFSQAKIFTTAMFSIMMLGRTLAARQWMALFFLAAGVAAVNVSMMDTSSDEGDAGEKNVVYGLVAVLCACCTSGFAGVYFEKVLKGSSLSVWTRNIHLAVIGVVMGSITAYIRDGQAIQEQGLLAGYNGVVWGLVAVQAGGGLLVAAVVKYTDNILKAFSTSVAILITSAISLAFFNFPVKALFFAGASGVIYSIFLYGDMLKAFTYCKACPQLLGGDSPKLRPEDAPQDVKEDLESQQTLLTKT